VASVRKVHAVGASARNCIPDSGFMDYPRRMLAQGAPPPVVNEVIDLLADLPGALAVALGGSRAGGMVDEHSDWDLAVYYRGDLDTARLAQLGSVHPPGAWGRIMNGGAWLVREGLKVDVMLRDLDVVEHWSARAEQGRFEIDALLGYLAGCPTYSLLAERAIGRVIRGSLPEPSAFPAALAASAPLRWRANRDFSMTVARMHAERGGVAGTVGQAAKAIMEDAHARVCEQRRWVLNEKRMIEAAELTHVHAHFGRVPSAPGELDAWLAVLRAAVGASANG
jgi:hypothetical protein